MPIETLIDCFGFVRPAIVLDKGMAADKNNPERGVVRNAEDGPDLLGGADGLPVAVVDYDSRDISPSDIADIMLGKKSGHLPTVLPQDAGAASFGNLYLESPQEFIRFSCQ